ncbi:hypothetical protein [Desulfovirgula thermocuniculi]|uniref:hypothetical protein n=1 Tax=Desulfovirgula thermocuniculi TaxID=348842 RepID=UPI0003F97EDA|nr:hypothetical protein [Desulfovirgula thermocuniculi]
MRVRSFARGYRGEVVPWLLMLPLLFFLFFFAAVYLHLDAVRAGVALAAREGAREYGVQLGQLDPSTALSAARGRVRLTLVREGLLAPQDSLLPPGQAPPQGRRGASAEFWDSGEWVGCAVTYYLPCPLPGLPRLLPELARPDPDGPWWRSKGHFVFRVAASAKKEYRQ